MRHSKKLLLLTPLLLAAATPLVKDVGFPSEPEPESESTTHANHIFNAIHSSMRQFGSSLNHNGMSLFLATVPAGTQFYHGTYTPHPVTGMEWLAFEPEHAMLFARPRRRGPPRRDPPPNNAWQRPLADGNAVDDDDDDYGYMHTYSTKHDLHLLYLDGQSAAKSEKGTLDIQDKVLLNDSNLEDGRKIMDEYQRAADLCEIARTQWDGRIDGILRMEGGFEIILCSFTSHLDVVHILHALHSAGPQRYSGGNEDHFDYYRAVAARYDGIGGGRVTLDYTNFVTLFAEHGSLYFDETKRPRVLNDSVTIDRVRRRVTEMVLHTGSKVNAFDWQEVTDMIIDRYADRIEFLASGELNTLEALRAALDRAMRPFIDYGNRNASLETKRCMLQFWPVEANDQTVAAGAVKEILATMCATLLSAQEEDQYETALASIRALKRYLAWTTWKRCRGCAVHEVCFLPIWPAGEEDDFEQPKCRSNSSTRGYWRRLGPADNDFMTID